jgi:hypothetical protein
LAEFEPPHQRLLQTGTVRAGTPGMDPARATPSATPASPFRDGLGERRPTSDPSGESIELLCLRDQLTAVPAFEFALRERTGRLGGFRHAYFAHVRSVERLSDKRSTLAIASDRTPGVRLSELLSAAEAHHLSLDINAAICLLRQLVPAVAALHEHAPDLAHGCLGPERIIVGPKGRLMIVEHVMGSAIEQLRYSHERYWKDLRIAMPRTAGPARFDQRADVMQMGVTALSLILGRLLREEEYPGRVADAVSSAWAISARGGLEPLPAGLRAWLARTLQIDLRNGFATAVDARADFEKVLGDSDYIAAPASVESFLAEYSAAINPQPASSERSESKGPAAAPPVQKEPGVSERSESKPPIPIARIAHVPPEAPKPEVVAPAKTEDQHDGDEDMPIPNRPTSNRRGFAGVAAAAAIIVLGGGVWTVRHFGFPSAMAASTATGTLTVTTNPAGAQVVVDGEVRGKSPVSVALKAGAHTLELQGVGQPRTIPITIAAGSQVSQYIELPKVAASTGQLQVRTEPAGANVTVDGVPRGPSPATIADLAPGTHTVSVESSVGTMKQSVVVEAGVTASLMIPLAAAENVPVSGWLSVSAPVDVQILEGGRLIGSSQTDRIMVSAGKHEIELVNDTLGYRGARTVQVLAGKVTPIKLDFPKGTMSLNAIPWAEVWIDGQKIGETPIGNVEVTIGPHEVLFRNPDLGEQRNAVTVKLNAPTRLSVDMRKKP